MIEREQFTFYRSYWQALRKLGKKDRLVLYEAFIGYGLNGTEPEGLTVKQTGMFEMARPSLRSGRNKAIKALRRKADDDLRELMMPGAPVQGQGQGQEQV